MKTVTIQVPDDFPEEIVKEAERAWQANRPDLRAKKERKLRELLDAARSLDLDDVEAIAAAANEKQKAKLGALRAKPK